MIYFIEVCVKIKIKCKQYLLLIGDKILCIIENDQMYIEQWVSLLINDNNHIKNYILACTVNESICK